MMKSAVSSYNPCVGFLCKSDTNYKRLILVVLPSHRDLFKNTLPGGVMKFAISSHLPCVGFSICFCSYNKSHPVVLDQPSEISLRLHSKVVRDEIATSS